MGPVASSLQFRADSADVAAATTVPPPAKRAKETSGRTGRTTARPVTVAQADIGIGHRTYSV